MRETRILMGMPITVEVPDCTSAGFFHEVFGCFAAIDRRFSPFRPDSEVTALNEGRPEVASAETREVLALAEHTKRQTHGHFDIRRPDGLIDPSGVAKGWAIRKNCRLIEDAGFRNYLVDAGGDIQSRGKASDGTAWKIGIRNPFNRQEIVKAVRPLGRGIATSGTDARGQHIYNPHRPGRSIADIVSLTVIGPDVLTADLYATAAFAMGRAGIYFIESLPRFEAYMIDSGGIATQTTGFKIFVVA